MKLSMTGQEKGDLLIRVGKKAGNTHISQDSRKYWEVRLILNLQI